MKKHYTIKYVYAGINQYADFSEVDGVIVNKRFYPQYIKSGEAPDLTNLNTIDEILEAIKAFSFHQRAEIYLINGMLPEMYNNVSAQDDIIKSSNLIEEIIENECYGFFIKHIKPILIKNDWSIGRSGFMIPVLINKDEDGEWQNIPESQDSLLVEFMCYKFMNAIKMYDGSVKLQPESHLMINGFRQLFDKLSKNQIDECGLYIEL